jgi:hypothetical protein
MPCTQTPFPLHYSLTSVKKSYRTSVLGQLIKEQLGAPVRFGWQIGHPKKHDEMLGLFDDRQLLLFRWWMLIEPKELGVRM